MATVRLQGAAINDWQSFHTVCAREMGFPAFYGHNMNAWIDCLTYLDERDGMSRFVLAPGEVLEIEVLDSPALARQAPEILAALQDSVRFVNERDVERGGSPRLQLRLK